MEKVVEKIKETEWKASKLITSAETQGKKMLSEKRAEIEDLRAEMDNEVRSIIEKAKKDGENDAEAEIAALKEDTDRKIAELDEKFSRMKDEIIKMVIGEF